MGLSRRDVLVAAGGLAVTVALPAPAAVGGELAGKASLVESQRMVLQAAIVDVSKAAALGADVVGPCNMHPLLMAEYVLRHCEAVMDRAIDDPVYECEAVNARCLQPWAEDVADPRLGPAMRHCLAELVRYAELRGYAPSIDDFELDSVQRVIGRKKPRPVR